MPEHEETPALVEQRAGPGCLPGRWGNSEITQLSVQRQSSAWRISLLTGETLVVLPKGRPGWLLALLPDAGTVGLSARDLPAGLRVSGYVHRLRQMGVPILTEQQSHGGPFPGWHAVYRLNCKAEPVEGHA